MTAGEALSSRLHIHAAHCRIQHRTQSALARHAWGGVAEIIGDGSHAVAEFCGPRRVVSLWPCLADARGRQAELNDDHPDDHPIINIDADVAPRYPAGSAALTTCPASVSTAAGVDPNPCNDPGSQPRCQLCPTSPSYWRNQPQGPAAS